VRASAPSWRAPSVSCRPGSGAQQDLSSTAALPNLRPARNLQTVRVAQFQVLTVNAAAHSYALRCAEPADAPLRNRAPERSR
jgi:hypothetical protein